MIRVKYVEQLNLIIERGEVHYELNKLTTSSQTFNQTFKQVKVLLRMEQAATLADIFLKTSPNMYLKTVKKLTDVGLLPYLCKRSEILK